MRILESKFVQGFIKMANDGYLQGWHERNGGNLSYRLKAEEVEMIRPRLNAPGEWTPIGTEVPGLAGEFFLVTGSGKYFRNSSAVSGIGNGRMNHPRTGLTSRFQTYNFTNMAR